jgi:hypothetical protein
VFVQHVNIEHSRCLLGNGVPDVYLLVVQSGYCVFEAFVIFLGMRELSRRTIEPVDVWMYRYVYMCM